MTVLSYKLLEPVGGFDAGEVLDVTANFGDWHTKDVKLEARHDAISGSVELTWSELRRISEPAALENEETLETDGPF